MYFLNDIPSEAKLLAAHSGLLPFAAVKASKVCLRLYARAGTPSARERPSELVEYKPLKRKERPTEPH
jgi:hypothetical protein